MSNKYKLNIVFYVNGMSFSGDSLEKHSLGGSETAGLCMAREMAILGHDVVMFCSTHQPGRYDGVNYMPISQFQLYMIYNSVDICIGQRVPDIFSIPMKSKINILWQHDINLKRNRQSFRGSLWNIDEVWGLSDFHITQMAEVNQVPESLFWETRNGIDEINFQDVHCIERKPKLLIYTSRPERGLDILLNDIMPKIWERDREVELVIAGYDNTAPEMADFYNSVNMRIQEYQNNGFEIQHLGALTKKELYAQYQAATLYVYPTLFEEISCITAMECMACGLPVVTSKLAALPETLDYDASILIDGDARSPEYQEKFVNHVLDLFTDSEKRNSLSDVGIEAAKKYKWSDLAKEWEAHFYDMFKARTKNNETLAKHLYRNEDIMALQHLNIPKWDKIIEEDYCFSDKEVLRQRAIDQGEYYVTAAYGENRDENLEVHTCQRFNIAMGSMNNPLSILDYAGGVGNGAIQFVNKFNNCSVTTFDISEAQQTVGKLISDKHCKSPDKITWLLNEQDIDRKYDVVFAGEILEHIQKPEELIDTLESHCKENGQIFLTVPFGPWGDVETNEADTKFRGHLWNFNKSDIKDLFGKKRNLSVKMVSGSVNQRNKETLGWYVIDYIYDPSRPTVMIDLERKVNIQAPRQTISACMIIGGKQEGLLYRCINSIYDVVDEIIISDAGMSEEAREILNKEKYKAKVKVSAGINPLEVGFDGARNYGLQHATGDWILWIDSDEELLTGNNIFKYLRHNYYSGYSIRQHHFSAQPIGAFKADIPVRLFRNHKGIKFFGVVHEHPELELNKGVGESTVLSDVDIAHDGYLTEEGRRIKFNRNYSLLMKDREKYPDRTLGKFLEMRDRILICRYILEQTNGQVVPEVIQHCEYVIDRYKKDFLSCNNMMADDGLGFYSEALQILNRGMEYTFNINVHPVKALIASNDRTARFESEVDFSTYLMAQTKMMSEHYKGKYA